MRILRLATDVRHGARLVRKDPLFSLSIISIVASGVGVSAVIYGLVKSLLFSPLGAGSPSALHTVYVHELRNNFFSGPPFPVYRELESRRDLFDGVAASVPFRTGLVAAAWTGIVSGQSVSAGYFEVLELQAVRGRLFVDRHIPETMSEPQAVLSYSLWQRAFGASEDIVGTQVRLHGAACLVVGVAPRGFRGIVGRSVTPTTVWVLDPSGQIAPSLGSAREIEVTIRLKAGVDAGTASAELTVLHTRLTKGDRRLPEKVVLFRSDAIVIHPLIDSGWRRIASTCWILALFVLIVTCSNLGSSFISRSLGRCKELAIRMSLGASRPDVVGQLLAEQFVIVIFGCAIGIGCGFVAALMLARLAPAVLPVAVAESIDVEFGFGWILYGVLVCMAVSLVSSLIPAIGRSSVSLSNTLRHHETDSSFVRRGRVGAMQLLTILQVAMSVAVLSGVPILVISVDRDARTDRGFESEHAAFVSLDLGLFGYDRVRALVFYRQLSAILSRVPGELKASVSDWPSPDGAETLVGFKPSGPRLGSRVSIAGVHRVDSEVLRSAGVKLAEGRYFTEGDSRVAIIDGNTAARYWPGRSALGQDAQLGLGYVTTSDVAAWPHYQIVGVVASVRDLPAGSTRDRVYVPIISHLESKFNVFGHGDLPEDEILRVLASAIRQVDPAVRPVSGTTMAAYSAKLGLPVRWALVAVLAIGGLALVIATIGVFSVMEHMGAHQRREIAIRLALGGSRMAVARMMMIKGLFVVTVGVAGGLALSTATSAMLSPYVRWTPRSHAWSLALVVLVVLTVGAVGVLIPIVKAVRVDPSSTLKGSGST